MMKENMTPKIKINKKGGIDYANLRHTYENIVRANLSASLTLVCTPSSRRDTKIRAHFTKSLTSPSIHPSIHPSIQAEPQKKYLSPNVPRIQCVGVATFYERVRVICSCVSYYICLTQKHHSTRRAR